jgi:hypothetical protein
LWRAYIIGNRQIKISDNQTIISNQQTALAKWEFELECKRYIISLTQRDYDRIRDTNIELENRLLNFDFDDIEKKRMIDELERNKVKFDTIGESI